MSLSLHAQQKILDLDFQGEASLEEVILQLESNYGLFFSYKQADVEAIQFTSFPEAAEVNAFLAKLLQGRGLLFEIVDSSYIILTKVNILSETDNLSTRLCGNIIDHYTQKSLPGASIYHSRTKKGTTSEADGNFYLSVLLKDQDSLVVSYVGYEELKLPASIFTEKECETVALNYYNFGEDFIVVTDYLTDGIQLRDQAAFTELQINKISTLPGQAEPDVLKTIQFLPGISSPDGSASNINIRGGTADQNLILWEDIPIYHTAHYFGMLSAFNPYIINKTSVYRGGFGVEYGGRVSGLIDLKSDAEGKEKSKFGAGTNLISAYTNGHILLKDKGALIYSFRRSLTELWESPDFLNITKRIHQNTLVQNVDLNRLPEGIRINEDFKFFDSNVKASYKVTPKDELSAAWFYADSDFSDLIMDDKLLQRQEDTLVLENTGMSLSWKHNWGTGLSTKLSAVSTNYHYDYGYSLRTQGEIVPETEGIKNSKIGEQQLNLQNTYISATNHQFKLGFQWLNNDVKYELSKTKGGNSPELEGKDVTGKLKTLYGAYNTPVDKRIGLDAGLRVTYFQNDSDLCLEPRMRVWYNFSDQLNFHASAGKYVQFLSQIYEIEGDRSSIETPVWTLAGGKEVPVQDATQYQVGLVFHPKSWLFDIQAYVKNVDGLSSLATGFDEEVSTRSHLGESQIMGIDILAKKRWKNYQSWISYTYSKIEYKFSTFFDQSFAAPNDQRHNLNWANMWTFGNFECSLAWKMTSGRPYSLRENFEIIIVDPPGAPPVKEIIRPVVLEFNSGRLPTQHQLDASMSYRFQSKKYKNLRGRIGLSLFNIYHQTNIYSREFYLDKREDGPPRLGYVDKVRMGFTPALAFGVEW